MAKVNEDLLFDREKDSPITVKRYIEKWRRHKGSQARRNSRESNDWFRTRVSKDLNLKAEKIHKELAERKVRAAGNKMLIGRLHLFKYDALHKDKLPVWDAFPLVFFFDAFKGDGRKYGEKGVLYLRGINMHYLAPKMRLLLFTELVKLKNDSTLRDKTRLKLSWQAIKGIGQSHLSEHAVKTYRADHIRSDLAEVRPQDWEIVIFMQIAQWQKGGKKDAWRL